MYRGDERYVDVEGTLKKKTLRGVLIETALGTGWIARSCLGYATNEAIKFMQEGDEGIFRIMAWAAEKRGLV